MSDVKPGGASPIDPFLVLARLRDERADFIQKNETYNVQISRGDLRISYMIEGAAEIVQQLQRGEWVGGLLLCRKVDFERAEGELRELQEKIAAAAAAEKETP